ncbi:hypothetical protein BGZ58_010579 [Dissophora ornata]|nr:hypothetical protein BGZ58_010579 [Dissophora ornata]
MTSKSSSDSDTVILYNDRRFFCHYDSYDNDNDNFSKYIIVIVYYKPSTDINIYIDSICQYPYNNSNCDQ